ncbi:MAG: hypothetical protein IPH34_11140 [Chitinophagaceae bacterium]|nr:hypothetical protein [Chitinophagaceae bacterium]MBP6476761.1 hypothetical protein [Chitinophagaceae bacterium]MBP7108621.1 hypothetical protein [Chitinophagaceae bacterium]MBP7314560.1 hypothetical protein [Chitinophagaceae bacterium]HQX96516.1 hypothetical protein [Chitinophagaceae bacterium]
MFKSLIFVSLFAFSCTAISRSDKNVYIKHTVSIDTSLNDERVWYKVLESYPSNKGCDNKSYASSFLCIKENSGDTVLIINPCEKYSLKKGDMARIYGNVPKSVEILFVAFDRNKEAIFHNLRKVYGGLKIPQQ